MLRKYLNLSKSEFKIFQSRVLNTLVGCYIEDKCLLSHFFSYLAKKNYNLLYKIIYKKFCFNLFIHKKMTIPSMDFMITTKCTLQCEQCSSLMPYYNEKTHYVENFESFKKYLDALLKQVDKINRFAIIGGEPLLHKDLPKMIEYASKKKQITTIVMITNGTMMPTEELLTMLKKYKNKNYVTVSDYRDNNGLTNLRTEEVVAKFKHAGIVSFITNYPWTYRGAIKKENRSIEELSNVMFNCWQHRCTAYLGGELHLCSRSIYIKRNLDESIKDYIKIDNEHDVSQEIIKYFSSNYADACDWCHTDMTKQIPRGVQSEGRSQIPS